MLLLQTKNAHPRDVRIERKQHTHGYNVTGLITPVNFISVTTWAGSLFAKFDSDAIIAKMMNGKNFHEHECFGMTPTEIKAHWAEKGRLAADMGTALHDRIELFMNLPPPNKTQLNFYTHLDLLQQEEQKKKKEEEEEVVEWKYFLNYLRDTPTFIPFRTEWMVFDEDWGIAGCIDMVYLNEDGTLSIYDWKRCSNLSTDSKPWDKPCLAYDHIVDSKINHYAFQLNMYKAILERKYGFVVRELVLVQLHPNNPSYQLWPLPDLSKEVSELFQTK